VLLAAPGPGARLRDRGVAAWAALPQTAAAMEPVRQDWEELGWPRVVEAWTTRCASARGVALITDRVLCSTLDEARARAAEVSEARRLASLGSPLPAGRDSTTSPAPSSGSARRRRSTRPSCGAVAGTARAMARLRQHLAGHVDEVPRLAALGAGLADLGHVYHPILEAFDAEGRLVDHASDALGPLRRALAAIKGQLERRMKAMLEDDLYAPYLQDAYYTQREDRYVLPVRHDGKGFIKGIVHGTSGSGQTLFIEPDEIVDLNNRMKLAECDVLDEERRILARFSGWVAEEADAFDRSLAIAAHLDLVGAAGRLADDLVAAEPILDEAPRLALLHARHPLMLLAGRRCVANDLALGAGQTLVVSGPNAGGKTVALKAAGLAALMARAGLHVAAESGSVVGWFTDVRTDIGDAQSLEQNLSTFTGHVKRLGEFLAEAGPGTLLLVDEIAVGTDPEQGAALAQAVLEALAARGLTAIVTTHYDRLKALAATDARFANASVGYDLSRLEPTFKLHLGVPGSSGALTVARRAGLTGGHRRPRPGAARAGRRAGR
jgi:DNA mismatch repair protein MutS2